MLCSDSQPLLVPRFSITLLSTAQRELLSSKIPPCSIKSKIVELLKQSKKEDANSPSSSLKDNKLPQWMFITPNMTSDGHDTSVTVAGVWLKGFLGPLLDDKNFMQNTLVLLSFDENGKFLVGFPDAASAPNYTILQF